MQELAQQVGRVGETLLEDLDRSARGATLSLPVRDHPDDDDGAGDQ